MIKHQPYVNDNAEKIYSRKNKKEAVYGTAVAYTGFYNGRVSVTSHRDDVKILRYDYSSLDVLKCIVLQCFQPKLQLTMIKL